MADTLILEVVCAMCGYKNNQVYYTPQCTNWVCPHCGATTDLDSAAVNARATANRDVVAPVFAETMKRVRVG